MPLDGVQCMGFDRSQDNLQSLATTTFDSRSGTFLNKCHCGGINNNKGINNNNATMPEDCSARSLALYGSPRRRLPP